MRKFIYSKSMEIKKKKKATILEAKRIKRY